MRWLNEINLLKFNEQIAFDCFLDILVFLDLLWEDRSILLIQVKDQYRLMNLSHDKNHRGKNMILF
jgi:hypothetical protein